jgi:DNA-binding CsgD family transcriptional regulator
VYDDKLLDLIGEVQALLELDELVDGMLAALQRNVPSEYVSINDIGPSPEEVIAVITPPQPEHLHQIYAELAHENPLTARYIETRDGRPHRFSDVCSPAELHRTRLYERVYAPLGVEYQMAFTLPAPSGRILGVALSRSNRDYLDAEKAMIERARPFLIQAWRNALDYTAVRAASGLTRAPDPEVGIAALRKAGLTRRQAEVLLLIARGRSTAEVATELALSDRTVHKHLELSYRTLGVNSRWAASAMVWSMLAPVDEAESEPQPKLRSSHLSPALDLG